MVLSTRQPLPVQDTLRLVSIMELSITTILKISIRSGTGLNIINYTLNGIGILHIMIIIALPQTTPQTIPGQAIAPLTNSRLQILL